MGTWFRWPPPKREKLTPHFFSLCYQTPQKAGDMSPHPESSVSRLQNEDDGCITSEGHREWRGLSKAPRQHAVTAQEVTVQLVSHGAYLALLASPLFTRCLSQPSRTVRGVPLHGRDGVWRCRLMEISTWTSMSYGIFVYYSEYYFDLEQISGAWL